MDPVIATGLVNIGSNILQKILPQTPKSSENLGPSSFESNLKEIQSSSHSPHGLEALRTELKGSPELTDFLSQNSGDTITLDQMSDGSVRLLSSSGGFMTLRPESPTCAKANQFMKASISTGQNLSPDRKNSVILIA